MTRSSDEESAEFTSTYRRGDLVMDISDPNDSSQFIMVSGDARPGKLYPTFGGITETGLAVLDKVATQLTITAIETVRSSDTPPRSTEKINNRSVSALPGGGVTIANSRIRPG